MPLRNLNHFLILARDLEATRDFYVNVLGLTVGPRPPFEFPGYWLYLGDRAVVHLAGRRDDRGDRGDRGTSGTGPIDHVAFEASGLKDMVSRLEWHAVAHRHRKVPGQGLHQVFIEDPDGVTIELNFSAAEGAELEA